MKIDELLIHLDKFSQNRGLGRFFWMTQILAGFMGLSVTIFLIAYNVFFINIFSTVILPLFIFGMIFFSLEIIGQVLLNKIVISLKECNQNLLKIHNKKDEIGDILNMCNNIYSLIRKFAKFRYFVLLFYPKKIRTYSKIFTVQYSIILPFLNSLRSNLVTHIAEKLETLEQAKTNVEKNIGGNQELDKVSELQSARLDHQIDQFEELQKKLVKV